MFSDAYVTQTSHGSAIIRRKSDVAPNVIDETILALLAHVVASVEEVRVRDIAPHRQRNIGTWLGDFLKVHMEHRRSGYLTAPAEKPDVHPCTYPLRDMWESRYHHTQNNVAHIDSNTYLLMCSLVCALEFWPFECRVWKSGLYVRATKRIACLDAGVIVLIGHAVLSQDRCHADRASADAVVPSAMPSLDGVDELRRAIETLSLTTADAPPPRRDGGKHKTKHRQRKPAMPRADNAQGTTTVSSDKTNDATTVTRGKAHSTYSRRGRRRQGKHHGDVAIPKSRSFGYCFTALCSFCFHLKWSHSWCNVCVHWCICPGNRIASARNTVI